MRSNAFADHLIENGFEKVYVIEKGYKAFRNYVVRFFEQPLILKFSVDIPVLVKLKSYIL
jgi:tRNA 2-selenouridine synthase